MVVIRRWWDRWKITIVYVGLAASFLFAYHLNDDARAREATRQCEALTRVKSAAFHLAQPTSTAGVADPATAARIAASNAQKTQARAKLAQDLACS